MYLINRVNVMTEVMLRNRYRIAQVLKVDVEDVQGKWILVGEALKPEFTVNMEAAEGLTEAEVKEVMQSVYLNFQEEFALRMRGLRHRRA